MSDPSVSPSSHAEWLKSILADHRATVGVSPAFIMICTTGVPLITGQLVRAAGNATQIEEGDRVEPCNDWTLAHGIATTDVEGSEQPVTILVGLWSENGPIRHGSVAGPTL
jgi:hypothetical protein